jgi:NAD(P)-dependent dehydrogenase (short-subunit alcohol dehydrogenase family)
MAGTANKGVAWVTGAGTGIGRGIAKRLAEDGWRVAISARTARDLDSLVMEAPDRIAAFQLDVTDAKAADATGRAIEASFGPVDLAILNAGSYFPTTAEKFSVENFHRTVDLNLMGTVNCMGPIVPSMVARRRGHIAIMGSQTAFLGMPTAASYGATKAALNSMAEAFKPDFDRYGVTITIINPGFVKTPLTARNTFPMPFLMDLDDALDVIMRGLDQKKFAINFPRRMTLSTKTLAALPGWAKFAITRRMIPRG